MMRGQGKVETGAGTNRTRRSNHNNNININIHNDNDNIFREEQTDLLSPFQNHHFDLLAETSPSHNPDFVLGSGDEVETMFATVGVGNENENPPSHNPDFVVELDAEAGFHLQSRNPLETSIGDGVTNRRNYDIFPRNVTPSYSDNANLDSTADAFPFPLASAIEISDTEDDSVIPFVAALRIDETENVEGEYHQRAARSPLESEALNSVEATSVQPMCRPPPLVFSPGSSRGTRPEMGGTRRTEEPQYFQQQQQQQQQPMRLQRPPPLVFFPEEESTGDFPNGSWLAVEEVSRRGNVTPATSRSGSTATTSITTLGGNRTNWSRIYVLVRAVAGGAKRSLKKTLSKKSKKIASSAKEMVRAQKSLLREESDRLRRSTKEMARDQQAAMEALMSRRRRR